MSTTKEKKTSSKKTTNLKEMLLQIGSAFFHNMFEQFQENVRVKINEIVQNLKQVATVTFLIVIGVLFLFIGMANLIDSALGIKGAGFLFIGIALTMMGYLVHMLGKSSK